MRAILDSLDAMIRAAAPEATATLKWGQPFYRVAGETLCALSAHKAHVNLILPGASGTYVDPDGLLTGTGKTGKHLKLTQLADLPKAAVKRWLAAAVARARSG